MCAWRGSLAAHASLRIGSASLKTTLASSLCTTDLKNTVLCLPEMDQD